jgi:hypothetical protein
MKSNYTKAKGFNIKKKNEIYERIKSAIASDPSVSKKLDESIDLSSVLVTETKKLKDITEECVVIQKKSVDLGSIFDGLPISSLYNLCERERGKELSQASFKDLIKYHELRKQGSKIFDKKEELTAKVKVSQIELLQAQIDALIKNIDT